LGELNLQTKSRCDAALVPYKNGMIDKFCITAGDKRNGKLIAVKMREYLTQKGVKIEDVYVAPHGFNTAGEIDICIRTAYDIHFDEFSELKFVSVTSWYHCFRTRFLWKKRSYTAEVYAAHGGVRPVDILLEPLKFLNSFLRPYNSSKTNSMYPFKTR